METQSYFPALRPGSTLPLIIQAPGGDVKWALRTLYRRATILCLLALSCGLLFGYLVLQIPEKYTARSAILLDNRDERPVDIEAVTQNAFSDLEGVNSQIELLRLNKFSERVIRDLALDRDPEFNEDLNPATGVLAFAQQLGDRLSAWFGHDSGGRGPAEKLAIRTKLLDRYYESLRVELKRDTRVIDVHFTSSDPEKAARIADHIAQTFIGMQASDAHAATQRANEWLRRQIVELKQRVGAQDRAIEDFRTHTGLLAGKDDKILSERVSELTAQLVAASGERAQSDARLAQVRRLIREKGNAEAMQDVLQSRVIQNLVEAELAATRRVAELGQELGNSHPRMLAARAELGDIQRKITREVDKVVQSLESEAAVASAREAAIQKNLTALEARLGDANQADVKLRAMTQQLEADQQVLQAFLKRQQETDAQLDAGQTNARLISTASVPIAPSFPPKAVLISASFLLPLLLGSIVVLWLEYLDPALRSGEQVERMLGVRSLALIPMVRQRAVSPTLYAMRNPNSIYAESIRLILYSVLYNQPDAPIRSVLITSSQAGEGKTATATSLGAMAAMMGNRVVVVDCDLRRPSVHEAFGTAIGPGLAEVLRGACPLSDALHSTEAGVSVLPVGSLDHDTIAVSRARTKSILAELTASFDLVIVNGPPVIPVSETRVLGQLVDAVVLLGRWGKAHPAVTTLALKALTDAGARMLGVALSMVEVEKHAQYGFADSPYYDKLAMKYYLDQAPPRNAETPAARPRRAGDKEEDGAVAVRAADERLRDPRDLPDPKLDQAAFGADGSRFGMGPGDTPVVRLPLLAEDKGVPADASSAGRPGGVRPRRSTRVAFGAAAAAVLAAGATAFGWHLLRLHPDAPMTAGLPAAPAPSGDVPAIPAAVEAAAPKGTSEMAGAVRPAAGEVDVALPAASVPAERTTPGMEVAEQPAPASPPSAAVGEAEIALMLARGDEMLATSDAISARLFYGRAVRQGSAAAMTAMAGTHDPLVLASRNVQGVRPEPREAISWYRRAIAAGDAAADRRLRGLVDSLRPSGQLDAAEAAALLRAGE